MKKMNAKLDNIINDLKRAEDFMKNCNSKMKNSPVEEIIAYALENRMISSTEDIVYLAMKLPEELSDLVIKKYDEYYRKKDTTRSNYSREFEYAGVYSSLAELNAKYGTDFNQRCIPEGVIIRNNINHGRC